MQTVDSQSQYAVLIRKLKKNMTIGLPISKEIKRKENFFFCGYPTDSRAKNKIKI